MVGSDPRWNGRAARSWPLLLLALVLAGSGTVVLHDARSRLAAARETHQTVERGRAEMERVRGRVEERMSAYQKWIARGVITDGEDETAWAEAPRRVGEGRSVKAVRVEPSVPFGGVVGARSQGAVVRLSLRHEGELVNWVAQLRGGGIGVVRVEGCAITREVGEGGSWLEAECRLSRLTVPLAAVR